MVDKLKREGEPICYLLNQEEAKIYLSTYFAHIPEFSDDSEKECLIEASLRNEGLTEEMITTVGLLIHRVYQG